MKHIGKLIDVLQQYWIETKAVTAVVFALTIPVLVAAGGIGIDITQSFLVKSRLCNALDSAILAAAGSSGTESELTQRINDYMVANYPEREIGQFLEVQPTFTENKITARAKAEIDAGFTRVVGFEKISVSCESEVEKNVRGLEIALVLDVTGSMKGSKIDALVSAARKFIQVIYDKVDQPDDALIALVPYSATVNVGSIAPDIVVDQYPGGLVNPIPGEPNVIYDPTDPLMWQGCVMARGAGMDQTDDPGTWDAFWYRHTEDEDDNFWDVREDSDASLNLPYTQCNDRRTPNLVCPEDEIVPLTYNEAYLDQKASEIRYWCRGGTLGNLGMMWGWRVLSPTPPFDQGASYDDNAWQKVILMMTDGQNQVYDKPNTSPHSSDYTAYGRLDEGVLGTTNKGTALNVVNSRFADICEAIKREGIIIYTVTFGSGVNSTTKSLYRACATDSTKYLDAPSNQDLINTFEDIAEELSNLHLTQ